MKIISIKFLNLNSLKGEHNIRFDEPPFTESGLFAITGPTGAGKTTILDAITVGLYGRVHRHDKDASESMTRFTGESFAAIEFEVNDTSYRAKWSSRRSRSKPDGTLQTPKMELADAITDAIIIAHPLAAVQNKIVEICGLDYHQFLRSVMLSQGDFTRFLKASENERSELLEKMTDTGIYSKISTYVFEKARNEKILLETLRAKMNDVILLSDEEKAAINNDLEQKKKEEITLKKIKQDTELKLLWLQKIKGLQDKQALQSAELVKFTEQAKQNEPAFAKLNAHVRASVHKPALQNLDGQLQQRQQIEEKIAETEKQLPAWKEEVELVLAQLTEATTQLAAAQTALTNAEPLLDEVIIKDTEIEHQKKQVHQIKEAYDVLKKALEKAQDETKQKQAELSKCTFKKEELETWVNEHEYESNLEKDLPRFYQIKKELAAVNEAIASLQKELTKAENQQEEEGKNFSSANEKVENVKKNLAELKAEQTSVQQKLTETLGEQPLEETEKASNALPALIAVCKDQLRLAGENRKQLERKQEIDRKLQDVRRNQAAESEQLLQLEKEKQQAEDVLKDLQQLVELQIRIQKYDEERQQLEPDKPCPLCGAVHHPYVEHYQKSQVHQSQQKRDLHKKYTDDLVKKHREKSLEVNTLSNAVASLVKETGQLEEAVKEGLLSFEKNNKELPKPLNIDDNRVIAAVISNKEKDYKKLQEQLTLIRELQQKSAEIEKQINLKAQDVIRFEGAAVRKQERIAAVKKEVTRLQETTVQAALNKESIVIAAGELLAPYNIVFDAAKVMKTEEALTRRSAIYVTAVKDVRNFETAQIKLDAELKNAEKDRDDKSSRLLEQEILLNKEQESLQKLKEKRHELFGEKDAAKERKKLNDAVQQSKKRADEVQQDHQQKQQTVTINEAQNAERKTRLVAAEEKYAALHNQLLKTLAAEGIESIEALQALFISNEEEQNIAALQRQIEQNVQTTTGILKTIEEEYAAEAEKNVTAESEEALAVVGIKNEELIETLTKQLWETGHKLKEDERLALQHKEVAVQAELQQKECSRWDKISQLIGSADGKKFSKFAQGLTLARLTELANRHLLKLSDRYRILKSAEKDLELQIVDAYQADVVRPMTTLSGGESFLVSLSLALGLSDLAGSKTQINSLFIDEGFGTLDAETLDVAVSALENLHASGKMIGIISHVEALKERIGTQIEVSKQPGGYSKIKVMSYGKEYKPKANLK